ncbi:MAG TPA: Uma2 family endonuclease [Roseiarcus sp.]|nr:Uma2 family endonuclease [Roseiarcus sp.]
MSEPAERLMSVDEFLQWAAAREGKFELHDGRPVAMSPERVRHAGAKTEAAFALREAIRRAGLPCRAYVDGITVRARRDRAFVPDVLVVCPPPPPDAVEIDNPLIVIEVLSPSTEERDYSLKLEAYLSLPSLAHYLILDPVRRVVIHHARQDGARAATRIYHAGPLSLEPPGLQIDAEDLFEPESPA